MVKFPKKVAHAVEILKSLGENRRTIVEVAMDGTYRRNDQSIDKELVNALWDYAKANFDTFLAGLHEGYETETDEEVADRVVAICRTALLVNLKTPYAAFVEFSGHANFIRVSVRKSKSDYKEYIYDKDFYGLSNADIATTVSELESFLHQN